MPFHFESALHRGTGPESVGIADDLDHGCSLPGRRADSPLGRLLNMAKEQTLRNLRRIARAISDSEAARVPAIHSARKEGATWEQIAQALQMSRAGVIKLYNASRRGGETST